MLRVNKPCELCRLRWGQEAEAARPGNYKAAVYGQRTSSRGSVTETSPREHHHSDLEQTKIIWVDIRANRRHKEKVTSHTLVEVLIFP